MPRILALLDDRAGNNSQVLGIAERLRMPFETRTLRYNALIKLPFWLVGGCGAHLLDTCIEGGDIPHWPDVIISAGRRASRAAVQIKRQADYATGGKQNPLLVQIMRPEPCIDIFSVLVLPEHDSTDYIPKEDYFEKPLIIRTLLSPHGITPEKLAQAKQAYESILQPLTHPRIAVLVGGNSKHAIYTTGNWQALTAALQNVQNMSDSSLMITTSRRTGAVGTVLLSSLYRKGRDFFYDWEAKRGENNSFISFLAHADAIIVTGDSISMCSEAVATGKPVYIFTTDKTMAPKFVRFLQSLYDGNYARPFSGTLDIQWKPSSAEDSSEIAARLIKQCLNFSA